MANYYVAIKTDQNGLHSWTPPTYLQTYSGDQSVPLGDGYYDYTWVTGGSEYAVYEVDTDIDFTSGYSYGLFAHTNPSVVNGGPTSVNPGESVWDYAGENYWTPTFGEDEGDPYVPIYVFSDSYIARPTNTWQTISGGKDIYVDYSQACIKFSISVTANTTYTFTMYTYSENGYDGIMISTNGSLAYNTITLNATADSTSGYINHCTGKGTTKTATYTPTSSGTIYVYFRTDVSSLENYNNTGCSYGSITWVTGTTTTITLSKNGGSGGTNSVTGAYGSALPSITAPTRSGLVFLGYYDTSAISGGTQYYNSSGASVRNWDKSGSTYTLYARWLNKVTWSYITTYHYCRLDAVAASTTNGRRGSTLAMNPSCGTGTLSATLTSIYNDDNNTTLPSSSIGTGTNQWTLLSNGKTLTVPAGVSAANYEIHVSYTSPSGSNYTGETVTASAFFNVAATYVSNYGNVYDYYMGGDVASGEIYSGNIEPVDPGEGIYASLYVTQIQNFPASAFTMSTSTVSNYFDSSSADFRQWVTYNNGAKRQGTVTYSWSGSSTSFSSLGTTEYETNFDVTFNTLTLTANGEGGKSTVVDYLNGGVRSANTAGAWSAVTVSYTLSPNPYQFVASGGSVTLSKADISVPSSRTRTWTSGSTESQSLYSKSFGVKTTATGFSGTSDGNGNITVKATNNTSTNTRGTYVVRPLARYGSAGASPIYGNELSFTQAAGSVVYGNPVVTAYYYDNFPASALSNVIPYVVYEQESTWNGVSGSGDTYEYIYSPDDAMPSGHSMAFSSSSSTLSTGFTKGTNFATTGKVSAATRGKTTGAARSTHSLLSVVVTANGKSSSSKACTACTQVANYLVWGAPPTATHTTPVSLSNAGQTYTMSPTATQTGTYTSGSTDTFTCTFTYAVKTAKTGYSLGTGSNANKVTVTNNTSTTARNGFVVSITSKGKTGTNSTYISGLNQSASATKDVTFNQPAGAKVYGTPEIEGWSYGYYASAGGEVKTPSAFSYTQTWTWNGVAGSGGTYNYDTDGAFATHSYTSTGTLPTGCTKGSNFSTMGTITWASRGTTAGDILDASSNLKLTITANGKTSSAVTCSFCKQEANELGTTQYKNTSGTTGYNIVYNNPTVSFSSNTLSASGGSATVNCSVTNSTNWYYKYTSGSYSSLQTGEEAGTARWRITTVVPTGTTRFHEPSSGGSNLNIGGTNYTTYASGTAVTHDNMNIISNTDKVTVTAYNTGNTSKSASISSDNIVNELGTTKYKDTSGTTGYYSQTYDTPTSVTIGSGISAGGGSATLSCTCNDTFKYYLRYTSGSYTSLYTDTHASTITWSIYSQTCAGNTDRFSVSGSTLSHSSMTNNSGTDRVIVRATNANSTSKYANSSELSVTNSLGSTKYKNTSGTTGYYSQTYGTPTSVTIGSGLLASGGSATASCTCNDTFKYYLRYTSGTYTSLQTKSQASTITWSINSQTFTPDGGSASTTTRFSISGSTVSHSSMGTNVGTDTVTVKATNANSTSKTGTGSKSVTNAVDSISLTVGNNPISFGSSTTATVTATYTSTATQDVTNSATYSSANSTGIVSINEGTTVTGIYVDDYYLNDSSTIATIIARGGVREYLAENSQQEHCYEPNGTITYEGTTRYLWKFSSANSTDSTEHAYIVTTTNDPLTLLNSSSEYNVNNIFEQDLIVASLYSDKSTYDNPAQMAITKVVLG